MARIDQATGLAAAGEGCWSWLVPEGWQQGRGAWGGLVAGACVRAAQLSEPDAARTVRTVSVHMCGPVQPGPATLGVSALRIGSAMSTWSIVLTDVTGEVCAHSVVITGAARAADLEDAWRRLAAVEAPDLPPADAVPVMPVGPPMGPDFGPYLEFRPVTGVPLSGGRARCQGWVRFADQGSWDAPSVIAMVDGWWPATFAALPSLRPMATVTFAAHLLADPATVPTGTSLAYESQVSGADAGFTTETRRLWSPDGRLLVENHQSIVVIR